MGEKVKELLKKYDLLLVFIVILIVAAVFRARSFYNLRNLSSILKLSALIGIATLGESLVLLVKGVDISIGAVMGFTSVMVALLIQPYGMVVAIVVPLLICAVIGLTNGLLIVKGKIPPIITTLGMMWLLRGIGGTITNGKLIRIVNKTYTGMASASLFKAFPYFFLGLLIAGLLAYFVLTQTHLGRHLYAVGGNEEAAYYSGISVNTMKVVVFTIAAMCYGIAGIFMASYIRSGTFSLAEGYEFRAITAAALGGVALSGGEGNILRALLGAIILTALYSVLTIFSISPYLRGIFEGVILIGAVYVCLKK
jgi:ribose/xylose/arabinose/galactoside ABC-type transport system permease subunit